MPWAMLSVPLTLASQIVGKSLASSRPPHHPSVIPVNPARSSPTEAFSPVQRPSALSQSSSCSNSLFDSIYLLFPFEVLFPVFWEAHFPDFSCLLLGLLLFLLPRFYSPPPAKGKHTPVSPYPLGLVSISLAILSTHTHHVSLYQNAPKFKFLAPICLLNCSVAFLGAQNISPPEHPAVSSESIIFTWNCLPSWHYYFSPLRPQCFVTHGPSWTQL